ncbi:MAG: FAD binding domain-containing protein, partial [Bacteroidota bacterium]
EQLKKYSAEKLPALHHMLGIFGSLQIRNQATLGGNIGSASPIGDMLPLLIACKALVRLQSASSGRMIRIEDFLKGYRLTDIHPDELITAVHLQKADSGTIIRSYKVSRRKNMDISTVSGGFSLKLDQEKVSEVILAFGGMAAQTLRASKTEEFLTGKPWTRATVEEAMEILVREFSPLSDARAGADYRNLVARNLLMKFYAETITAGQ